MRRQTLWRVLATAKFLIQQTERKKAMSNLLAIRYGLLFATSMMTTVQFAVAANPVVTAEHTQSSSSGGYQNATTQTFTANVSGYLEKIQFKIVKVQDNSGKDMVVDIRETPTSSPIASITIPGANLPPVGQQGFFGADFSDKAIWITKGQSYAVGLHDLPDDSGLRLFNFSLTLNSVVGDMYTGGAMYVNGQERVGDDVLFRVYVAEVSRALPANTWLMTAPSCQPSDPPGTGIDAQYGNDIPGGVYGSNWVGWKWDAASQRYPGIMAGTDPLVLGEGNWVYSLNAGNLVLDGTAAPTEPCSNYGSGLTGQCFAIDLTPAAGSSLWQMVGHPFPYPVSWADVRVAASIDGGVMWTTYTPSQAEPASLMDKTIQRWSGSAYEAKDDATVGLIGTLQPQEAVWVRIKPGSLGLSGFKLLIPAR